MKMSKEAAEMFAKEIGSATKRGMTHFAKAVGMPTMKFAKSEDEARRLAMNSAKRQIRSAKISGPSPLVQSGTL